MSCGGNLGKNRWFYTGNQVGDLNFVGDFNFVAGGLPGSGISAGVVVPRFFQKEISRDLWKYPNSKLSQALLDACFPYMELQWIADIQLSNVATFRVSDRNIYVEDLNKNGRFYEARVIKAPSINITCGEWLAPNFEIGDFKLDLNNRDGFFNEYLPQGEKYLQWIGAKVSIKVGFGEKLSNYHEVFTGFVSNKQGVTGTHEIITIKCYDRTSEDEVLIPATTFDRTNHPNVDSESIGKSLPIIYGDWTEEVGDYGQIPAVCSNALDDSTDIFIWQISENSLREIGDIYLHRGDSIPGKDGPIKLLENVIVKQPELGRVLIPKGIPVLSRAFLLLDRARAGFGSGEGLLISESSSIDYLKLGVRVGDAVLIDGDPQVYIITSVGAGAITTNSGTFEQNTNYRIITDKYTFKKGDKVSVFCKGKDLKVMSTTRMANAGLLDINPLSLSIGLDNSYWFVQNDKKVITQVSFSNRVLRELKFEDIDPEIENVSSIDISFDGTLWILERNKSKIYRYIVEDQKVGLSFTTSQIIGIGTNLQNPSALCIDDANLLTIVDNNSGRIITINPFGTSIDIVRSFNRDDFDPQAIDISDISVDVNNDNILVVDRSTNKFYRLSEDGDLISSFLLNSIDVNFTYPVGIGYYIDGTIFLLNRNDNAIYNYNEFDGASENVGFIARDILQKYANKTAFDFDLMWNETCRSELSSYKARVFIDEKTQAISHIHKFLSSFNTNAFIRYQKYALFHITFDNLRTDGDILREGDIKLGSFNPSKEYNQYFNGALGTYNSLPFDGVTSNSDVYVSPAGVKLAGRAIIKELNLTSVYRRDDLDKLIPLFVRLASAEPEFINLTVGFRFLFTQLNTFFNINFYDLNPQFKTGRRYKNVPSFVRKIEINLANMEFKLKLWSLGTTQFGNYVPIGTIAGGENDQIVLTNLGTPSWISPVGSISEYEDGIITIEDVDGQNAENRIHNKVGKAWKKGYKLSIVSGLDQTTFATVTIDKVEGNKIFIVESGLNIETSIKNSAGFHIGGHYIKYAKYNQVVDDQRKLFGYFTKPLEGYPTSTTNELEEQRAGAHNFDDRRLPYLLHPKGYEPQI